MASTHLLRINQVSELTARSHAAIYADIKKGTFPPPVKIGPRSSRWRAEDIQVWIEQLPTAELANIPYSGTTHTNEIIEG